MTHDQLYLEWNFQDSSTTLINFSFTRARLEKPPKREWDSLQPALKNAHKIKAKLVQEISEPEPEGPYRLEEPQPSVVDISPPDIIFHDFAEVTADVPQFIPKYKAREESEEGKWMSYDALAFKE